MKRALIAAACFAALPVLAQQQVDGYTRKDGTYVAPHYRTTPDNTRANNYGSQGNVNPYTGQQGTRDPYAPPPNPYGQPQRQKNGF